MRPSIIDKKSNWLLSCNIDEFEHGILIPQFRFARTAVAYIIVIICISMVNKHMYTVYENKKKRLCIFSGRTI